MPGSGSGARLKALTGEDVRSCGPGCTDSHGIYGSVGRASVTFLWGDVVLAPFEWRVSPNLFVGALYRWDSFSPSTPAVGEYYSDTLSSLLGRYGFGFDIRASNSTIISLAFAAIGVHQPRGSEPLATIGMRFPVR